jgi:hypothetical protein
VLCFAGGCWLKQSLWLKQVRALQHGLEQLQVADRQLERTLRKQFAGAPQHLPALMALVKHRMDAIAQTRSGDTAVTGVTHVVPDSERPTDMDAEQWQTFKTWFSGKMEIGLTLAQAQAELIQQKLLSDHLTDELQRCVRIDCHT